MNRTTIHHIRPALLRSMVLTFLLVMPFTAWAHETRIVGPEGGMQYAVTVGMLNEPVFTDVRTGLDLIVRAAESQEPVEGLETSLRVTITAPTGDVRVLEIRPQYGAPGAYADDYILTTPGTTSECKASSATWRSTRPTHVR